MADSKHRILCRNREEVENQEGLIPTVRFYKIGANWEKLLKVKLQIFDGSETSSQIFGA